MKENQEKKENLNGNDIIPENYDKQNNEYQNLTPEQNKILSEINILLRNFVKRYKETHDHKFYEERQSEIVSFKNKLEDKGLSIYNYILGCRVIHGTPEENVTEFDTPDHDIEKFIRNLRIER
ncbi:MAG: hypothetical protein WC933_02420 [Candidatus Paceibacterota bacterium]|jgi:hypothetical protein